MRPVKTMPKKRKFRMIPRRMKIQSAKKICSNWHLTATDASQAGTRRTDIVSANPGTLMPVTLTSDESDAVIVHHPVAAAETTEMSVGTGRLAVVAAPSTRGTGIITDGTSGPGTDMLTTIITGGSVLPGIITTAILRDDSALKQSPQSHGRIRSLISSTGFKCLT